MPFESLLDLLKEIESHEYELEILDSARVMSRSAFGVYAKAATDDLFSVTGTSQEYVGNLRPQLHQALLELSPSEAQQFLNHIKGTVFEGIFARNLGFGLPPFKHTLKIFALFWPDHDLVKMVDDWIKKTRSQQPEYRWDQATRKEFDRTKEKALETFLLLKDIVRLGIANADVIGLTIDILALHDPEDAETISKLLTNKICRAEDSTTVEVLARFLYKLAPESTEREFRKQYMDSIESQAKENIKRALLLLGKNPLTIVQGDQFMGDHINLTGDFRGANVPIKSLLHQASVSINNSSHHDESIKIALEELIRKLNEALSKAPPENVEESEAVAETAKMLVETATQEKPNKTTIKITTEGLLKAAENISKVIPAVLPIVKQIIALLITW